MAVGVHMGGADQFRKLAARMDKAATEGPVIKSVGAAVDRFIPQVEAAIHQGAERLPTSGGLAKLVATTKLTRKTTRRLHDYSVKLTAQKNAVKRPDKLDKGMARHPIRQRKVEKERGRKALWVLQKVPPGWFSEPPQKLRPAISAAAQKAVDDAIRKV